MFPELPDAKIEIRKPIAAPSGCSNRPMRASALRPAHYEAAHSTELPASSHRHKFRSTKKQRKCGNRHALLFLGCRTLRFERVRVSVASKIIACRFRRHLALARDRSRRRVWPHPRRICAIRDSIFVDCSEARSLATDTGWRSPRNAQSSGRKDRQRSAHARHCSQNSWSRRDSLSRNALRKTSGIQLARSMASRHRPTSTRTPRSKRLGTVVHQGRRQLCTCARESP